MSRFVRSSKYRHVFGKEATREQCYDQIKVTRSAWDTNTLTASTKFWGCIWEAGGGGAFVVSTYADSGKRTPNPPLVAGHKAAVLDISFSNFNPYIIASASEDCMVKIWQIPEDGLTETMTEEAQLLKGHKRKVGLVNWHPTADNVLATAGTDYVVKFWDVEAGDTKLDIKGHKEIIQSFGFNWDGSKMVTSSKDKKLRLVDPRADNSIVSEWHGHDGVKGMRALWMGDSEYLVCSIGFSRSSDRQYRFWDIRKEGGDALVSRNVDTSAGMLMPFFDNDTKMLYLGGKGDGNIRYYEVIPEDPEIAYYLSEYKSSDPQKGLTTCPKTMLDVPACEVTRFLKVTAKNQVIPISFNVPRKSDLFQDDIYPDTYAGKAALSAEEWFGGSDAQPVLVSMEPEEGAIKQSEAPPKVEFKKKEEEKELEGQELKDAYSALQKRVAYLEAELLKRDLKIKELEDK